MVNDFFECCIGFSKRLFQRGSGDCRAHDGLLEVVRDRILSEWNFRTTTFVLIS